MIFNVALRSENQNCWSERKKLFLSLFLRDENENRTKWEDIIPVPSLDREMERIILKSRLNLFAVFSSRKVLDIVAITIVIFYDTFMEVFDAI